MLKKINGKTYFLESLNNSFGYYYTVNKHLFKEKTQFQKLELIDTDEFGTVLLLDEITQVGEKNDFQYHEPMVHPALCSHPDPRDILVIGGGDGGILREVLKHNTVRSVQFAELDEKVVAFSRKHLSDINNGAFDDPRVTTHFTDGRAYVADNPGRFDIVIMDMTDPFGPSKMLYTKEFFTLVKKSFKNKYGCFTMHSESPIVRPVAFNAVRKTLAKVFSQVDPLYTYIQMYATYWSMAVASDGISIKKKTRAGINNCLKKRGVTGLKLYNGDTHRSMQVSYPYIDDILKQRCRIITDTSPDFIDNIHTSK